MTVRLLELFAVLEAVMRNIYSPDASIATLDRWSA